MNNPPLGSFGSAFLNFLQALADYHSRQDQLNLIVSQKTGFSGTLLDNVVHLKLYSLLDIFLKAGSDPTIMGLDGLSPLTRAIVNGDFQALQKFSQYNVDFNQPQATELAPRPSHYIAGTAQLSHLKLDEIKSLIGFLMYQGLDPSLGSGDPRHDMWSEFQWQIRLQEASPSPDAKLIRLYIDLIKWKESSEFAQLWKQTQSLRSLKTRQYQKDRMNDSIDPRYLDSLRDVLSEIEEREKDKAERTNCRKYFH